jgi:P pilus assembly chaperone PapD
MNPRLQQQLLTSAVIALTMLAGAAHGEVNISGPRTLEMRSGETRTVEYTIVNNGDEPVQATVFFNDYAQQPDGTLQHVPARSLPQSLFNVAEFERLEFVLPAGASARVPVTISLPTSARGGYWGVIGVESPPPPNPVGANAVTFNIRYAMVTSLEVEGVVEHDVAIENVGAVREEGRTAAVVTVRNSGSAYERFQLSLKFEGPSGSRASFEEAFVILPNMTIDLPIRLPETLSPGTYGIFATIHFRDGMRSDAVGVLTVED